MVINLGFFGHDSLVIILNVENEVMDIYLYYTMQPVLIDKRRYSLLIRIP